jgi:hypothetical protein
MATLRPFFTRNFVLFPLLLLTATMPDPADAHGFAGKRYFPATLTFDDPFTQDEFGLLYSSMPDAKSEDGDTVDTSALSVDYAKSITPGFALSVGTAYTRIKSPDGSSQHGFDNIEAGAKILGNIYEESESVWSYGLDVDLGGTSSHGIGESYSIYSPSLYFGKGFGTLFDNSSYWRALAVTGKIAVALPEQDVARSLDTAFAVEYSMSYLSSFVKDVGAPRFLRDSFLIVEMPLETCLDHGCDGDVTGTVNPGIIFFNHWGQLSFEAQIPVNNRTGDSVGGLLQLHFNLDDVFPDSLGRPIFR